MKVRKTSRLLSIVLLVAMLLTLMPATALAEDSATTTWTQTTLAEITTEDTVAITMNVGGNYVILPTSGAGSSGQPLANVTGTVSGSELSTDAAAASIGWTVTVLDKEKDWCQIAYTDKKGITRNGWMMTEFLQFKEEPDPTTTTYTVHVPFLPQAQAEGLVKTYSGAWMTPDEGGDGHAVG